jgi:hypothetical protein
VTCSTDGMGPRPWQNTPFCHFAAKIYMKNTFFGNVWGQCPLPPPPTLATALNNILHSHPILLDVVGRCSMQQNPLSNCGPMMSDPVIEYDRWLNAPVGDWVESVGILPWENSKFMSDKVRAIRDSIPRYLWAQYRRCEYFQGAS